MTALATITIPADHDADTLNAMAAELDAFLDYELQADRLDDRTREALIVALELLRDVAGAYPEGA